MENMGQCDCHVCLWIPVRMDMTLLPDVSQAPWSLSPPLSGPRQESLTARQKLPGLLQEQEMYHKHEDCVMGLQPEYPGLGSVESHPEPRRLPFLLI